MSKVDGPVASPLSRYRTHVMQTALVAFASITMLSAAPSQARAPYEAPKRAPVASDGTREIALRQAADHGDLDAMLSLGMLLGAQSQDRSTVPAETIRYWTQAADAGHVLSAFALGMTYSTESVGLSDPVKARHYLGLAVAGGARGAAVPYMAMLASGEGGPVDMVEAERLLPFAAAVHVRSTDADIQLVALREATHLPEWTATQPIDAAPIDAAMASDADAMPRALSLLATQDDAASHDRALGYLTAAADAGDANAQIAMAVLLATDQDDPTALSRSIGYTRRAAAQGDSDALFQLGSSLCACSMDKDRVIRGLVLLDLAAQRGSFNAFAQRAATLEMVDPQWADIASAQADICREQGIALCGILDAAFPDEKPTREAINPDMIAAARTGGPQGVLKMRHGRGVVVATNSAK